MPQVNPIPSPTMLEIRLIVLLPNGKRLTSRDMAAATNRNTKLFNMAYSAFVRKNPSPNTDRARNRNVNSFLLNVIRIGASPHMSMTIKRKVFIVSAVVMGFLCMVLPELAAFLPILFYNGVLNHLPGVIAVILPYLYLAAQGETAIGEILLWAMNSIRESVHDLHDDSIDLRQAILEATQAMRENYMIRIDYDMSKAVPRNVKYCFIATVKEAMSNVVKHSNADKIEIVLREHPGFYQLFIGDNGMVKKAKTQQDGIGLSNMRERVEMLGGTVNIDSENGFRIMINIARNSKAVGNLC